MLIYRSTCNPSRSNLSVIIFLIPLPVSPLSRSAKISFSKTLLIFEATFHFTAKMSIALCWPIYLKTLKVFLLGSYTWHQTLQVIRKNFPEEFPHNYKSVGQVYLWWRMSHFPDLHPLPLHFLRQDTFSF